MSPSTPRPHPTLPEPRLAPVTTLISLILLLCRSIFQRHYTDAFLPYQWGTHKPPHMLLWLAGRWGGAQEDQVTLSCFSSKHPPCTVPWQHREEPASCPAALQHPAVRSGASVPLQEWREEEEGGQFTVIIAGQSHFQPGLHDSGLTATDAPSHTAGLQQSLDTNPNIWPKAQASIGQCPSLREGWI